MYINQLIHLIKYICSIFVLFSTKQEWVRLTAQLLRKYFLFTNDSRVLANLAIHIEAKTFYVCEAVYHLPVLLNYGECEYLSKRYWRWLYGQIRCHLFPK